MYIHLDYTVRLRQKQKKLPLRLNKKGLYRQKFSINERNLIPKKEDCHQAVSFKTTFSFKTPSGNFRPFNGRDESVHKKCPPFTQTAYCIVAGTRQPRTSYDVICPR